MGEMIYSKSRTTYVLDKGKEGKFNWAIVSYGTHPCAYVRIPKGHKLYGKSYDGMRIDCHGGLTFAGELCFDLFEGNFWIGWDYVHAGDYAGYYMDNPKLNDGSDKKWTTAEIKKHIMNVIKQIDKGAEWKDPYK